MLELLIPDMGEFTNPHTGKSVYNQDGGRVGTVADVHNGALYVDVTPDADDNTIRSLNWKGAGPHHLNDRYVSNVGEEVVRLNV